MKPHAMIDCNDDAARLLPWYVNGTLGADEARRVAAHLERCPACHADAAHLEAVRTLLRSPVQVEYAPQAGLRKLMTRVEQEARTGAATSTAAAPVTGAVVPPAVAVPRRHGTPLRNLVHWLAAAVVVQACAIAVIVGANYFRPAVDAPEAPYRTLTTNAPEGPRLRVVFVPTMTLAELQDLLRANQLVAVAGPSETGIFTLALRAPAAGADVQAAVLARLRADARVRFAEPVGGDGGAR
jgi:anti-sigma factor RsiW